MDQQMPAGELWQWVHSSYGDQLGLTSDDDDYIAPSTTEDDQKHAPHIVPSEPSYVASSSGSDKKTATKTVGTGGGHGAPMAAGDAPASLHPYTDVPASDTGEGDSRVPDAASHAEFGRSSPAGEPLHPASVTSLLASSKPVSPAKNKASSKHSSKHSSPIKTLSTVSVNNVADIDHTDSVDSDDQSSRVSTGLGSLEVVVCPVQKSHHVGREIVNTVYAIPIDSLFTLLFTNSKMMLEVHALRKTTDVVASPWQSKNDGQQRLRQVTYTVALPTNSFGPKVSHVTETQVMSELTVPGEYYSVDAEASNAGIPYAESFLVSNHWCLTRESCSETRLAVYTSVKYKKNMWGFMKSVIDKNACSGVEGLLQGIDSALQQEVTEHANMHQRTRRRRRRGTVKLESEVPGSVPGLMPAADVTAAGTGVAALKDKTKAKLPVNNILVNRLLGSTAMRPPALARPPALGSGTAALNAAWRDDSVDTTSMSWPNCRVLIMTFLLLLLLCTNLMLFWRLTKLEELVRLQPHYAALRGFMQLDPDVVRKEIRSDAMLQILQEQEVAHVKMTEDWRTRISEAETLLHQAEGMLRGLHATIPTEQSAASRALLERLRESSLSLQADIDSSVQTGPELPYNFNDLESDSSHSRHEL
ncbi:protein Aster-B isoform X3 [Hyalella azteca]|uniref:Protein Aster-B isoform X2 n=1 Tax=Hyalella azteca TaxID=294128 RepID=A0A8B7N7J2_HYAAZ|nr:protein Aster-B isoform X2 [Hyalella azteca]XP_047737287.1 protein Aster-B isoform X3 [Hyalella azteca]